MLLRAKMPWRLSATWMCTGENCTFIQQQFFFLSKKSFFSTFTLNGEREDTTISSFPMFYVLVNGLADCRFRKFLDSIALILEIVFYSILILVRPIVNRSAIAGAKRIDCMLGQNQ